MFGSIQDKLIAGTLAVALAASVSGNIAQAFKVRDLKTTNATLSDQINNPTTGYVTRLGTCRSNVETLSAKIDRQNATIATASARSASAIAAATKAVSDAQAGAARAERQAAEILNTPLHGDTSCERAEDADKRILESLK